MERLRICSTRHGRLEGLQENTSEAYRLMCGLAGRLRRAVQGHSNSTGRQASSGPATHLVKVGCINPHRNGLVNVQGTAVAWSRLKDPRVGLLRTMHDFNFAFLGLPACRVPTDFVLPSHLGADLAACGGTSYASVGVLRPLEVAACTTVVTAECSSYFIVYIMRDMVFVIFALPTPAGPVSDRTWVQQLEQGKNAGCRVAATRGIDKIVWMGDFNYEPTEISGRPDPRKSCRDFWPVAITSPRMTLLNPKGVGDDGPIAMQRVQLPSRDKEVYARASTTFTQGGRGLDLMLVSDALVGKASIVVHNGVHCAMHGCG